MPKNQILGLVILVCCPAANTGNIMCLLARGNVALMVATTLVSAILTPFITPMIIYVLLHKTIHVQLIDNLCLISSGITLPMLAGMLVNCFFPTFLDKAKRIIPSLGILAVSSIIALITAEHAEQFSLSNHKVFIVSAVLIVTFLSGGFFIPKWARSSRETAIAMSFEMGTFDGVLAILLVMQIMGQQETFPVVLFVVLNLIIGAIASKLYGAKRAPMFVPEN